MPVDGARAVPLDEQFRDPASEEGEHEIGADQCRGCGAGGEIGEPPAGAVSIPAGAGEAGADQPAGGVDSDGGDGRSGAGARAADPKRWRVGEEQQREREDQDDGGNDETQAADDRAGDPGNTVGAEDR